MLMAVLIGVVMTGCMGTPHWVKEGSGVHKAKGGPAIYGVGKGLSEVDQKVQSDLASMGARTAAHKAQKNYVAAVLKDFVEAHPKWFNLDQIKQMDFYEMAAAAVADKAGVVTEKVDEWVDSKGAKGEAGTLYVLRRIALDKQFFANVEETLKSVIEQNKDQILRVEIDEVLAGLKKEIQARINDPLGAAVARMEQKKMDKAAATAEKKGEMKEKAEEMEKEKK
jgi:hypothetical protein